MNANIKLYKVSDVLTNRVIFIAFKLHNYCWYDVLHYNKDLNDIMNMY